MSKPINAGTAVFCGDSVLLVKRIETYKGNPVPFGGYWSIFCGSAKDKEEPLDTAYRELYEESKIVPEKIQKIRFFRSFFQQDEEFFFYTLEVDEFLNPDLNFEHTEFGWFKIRSLHSFPEKIDDQILFLINEYNNDRII